MLNTSFPHSDTSILADKIHSIPNLLRLVFMLFYRLLYCSILHHGELSHFDEPHLKPQYLYLSIFYYEQLINIKFGFLNLHSVDFFREFVTFEIFENLKLRDSFFTKVAFAYFWLLMTSTN